MSAPHPDHRLEAEIRAMLQRRAQDVRPEPPPWRELAQRNGAVVISLRTGAPVDRDATRRRRLPSRHWVRGVVAAAVALILAMAGALLVQGSDPAGDTADGPEPLDVPSAGQRDFDATRATPLWPVTSDASTDIPPADYLSDPTATAEEFLDSVDLPVREGLGTVIVGQANTMATANGDEPPIQTALVAWSLRAEHLPDNPPLAQGIVYLRNPQRAARDTWLVVGVSTLKLWVTDIQRDGDTLSFIVDRSTDDETYPEAAVTVDDVPIGTVGIGEAIPFTVPHPAGRVAIIEVQHMEAGMPTSITSTAVPALSGGPLELPEDAAPMPTAPAIRGDRGVEVEVPHAGDPAAPTVPPRPRTAVAVPVDPTARGSTGRIVVSPG